MDPISDSHLLAIDAAAVSGAPSFWVSLVVFFFLLKDIVEVCI